MFRSVHSSLHDLLTPASALSVVSVLVFACANTSKSQREGDGESNEEGSDVEAYDQVGFSQPGRGEALPSVTYGETAELNWERGEEAFADEEYLAAQRYYAFIRSKFPYSRYAIMAESRIGDCQFGRGRFIEAIDTFQNFLRAHPAHELAGHAMFKIGEAYYEQIPGDWFLVPPSHEKDQASVKEAERALSEYVDRFPKHEDIARGSELLREVRERLVAHERYAADYYRRINKDRAYVGRLEVIRTRYGDVALDDELLLEIAEVWARLGEAEKVKSAVDELASKYPASPRLEEARRLEILAPVPILPAEKPTARDAEGPGEALNPPSTPVY